jgi:DNA-binding beta-propeller fold protein YncE
MRFRHCAWLVAGGVLVLTATLYPRSVLAESISGRVLSGSAPISGTRVTLYGTATRCGGGPYSSCSAAAQQAGSARTDADGRFSIRYSAKGFYSDGFYLIARGGKAGGGAAIALALAVGQPPNQGSVTINEFTTVATVFALAHSMYSGDPDIMVGGQKALLPHLVNFATAKAGDYLVTGRNSPAALNTLADILWACVHSAGPKATPCTKLFKLSTPSRNGWGKGSEPHDTLAAALDIAQNPTHNAPAIFRLLPGAYPYTPALSTAPGAWILSLNFSIGGLRRPTALMTDSQNKALWVANTGGNSVVALSSDPASLGAPLSPIGGYRGGGISAPSDLKYVEIEPGPASSPTGASIWVTNPASNSVTILSFTRPAEVQKPPVIFGVPTVTQLTGNGLDRPSAIIFVPNNLDWVNDGNDHMVLGMIAVVVNAGAGTLSLFKLDGTPVAAPQSPPFPGASAIIYCEAGRTNNGAAREALCIANPRAHDIIAVDPPSVFTKRLIGASPEVISEFRSDGFKTPRHLAWTSPLWISDCASDSVAAFDGDGHPFPDSPFKGGGLACPQGIVIDGDHNVWIANSAPRANSITELVGYTTDLGLYDRARNGGLPPLGTPLSPADGFSGAGLDRPYGITVDQNGNVWVSNQGGDSVTCFVGVAKPPMETNGSVSPESND